jgi:hypothetical protein
VVQASEEKVVDPTILKYGRLSLHITTKIEEGLLRSKWSVTWNWYSLSGLTLNVNATFNRKLNPDLSGTGREDKIFSPSCSKYFLQI